MQIENRVAVTGLTFVHSLQLPLLSAHENGLTTSVKVKIALHSRSLVSRPDVCLDLHRRGIGTRAHDEPPNDIKCNVHGCEEPPRSGPSATPVVVQPHECFCLATPVNFRPIWDSSHAEKRPQHSADNGQEIVKHRDCLGNAESHEGDKRDASTTSSAPPDDGQYSQPDCQMSDRVAR